MPNAEAEKLIPPIPKSFKAAEKRRADERSQTQTLETSSAAALANASVTGGGAASFQGPAELLAVPTLEPRLGSPGRRSGVFSHFPNDATSDR